MILVRTERPTTPSSDSMPLTNSRRLATAVAFPFVIALATIALPHAAPAQCAQWLPGDGYPGVGIGYPDVQTSWDPDGPGPLGPRLVIGGTFEMAGSQPVGRIASYDAATGTWSPLGTGVFAPSLAWVKVLTTRPNGELIAAGNFTSAGGVAANNIASWNGSTWSPLGGGITGPSATVQRLTTLPNGDVVAAGLFGTAGGVTVNNVARWDGTSWHAMGGLAVGSGEITGLVARQNGEVFASGSVSGGVVRWNGTSWSPVPGAPQLAGALALLPNGDVLLTFRSLGFGGVYRWDGTTWSAFGAVIAAYPTKIAVRSNGTVVVGGTFAGHIAEWNGTAWSTLGTGLSPGATVRDITEVGSDVFVCGMMTDAGGVPVTSVARWNGTAWSSLGSGSAVAITSMVRMPNGDIVAGGSFNTLGGVAANRVARWNGSTWAPMGAGLSNSVEALAVRPNGSLVAAGKFGGTLSVLAEWNGTAWTVLANPVNGSIRSLIALPNGDLLAGGPFGGSATTISNIARWNGTAWSSLNFAQNASVQTLCLLSNGDVIAGGYFATAGGIPANGIARWNGTAWSPLGTGMNEIITHVVEGRDGSVLAIGRFTTAGGVPAAGIARWNGSTWSPLGSGLTHSLYNMTTGRLAVLPNGDLIATGDFEIAGGAPANRIARWNGSAWSPIGAGVNWQASDMIVLQHGVLALGGGFQFVDGQVSVAFARYVSTCPATAVVHGSGCTGSAGPQQLSALTLPWIGSRMRAQATGMPALSIALGIFGFGTLSVPMPAILSPGVPGCSLLVTPDVLVAGLPANGTFEVVYDVPSDPVFVGFVFHVQVAALELAPSGLITALTSTNALTFTEGIF